MYQFLINQNDADIEKLLKFLTDFSLNEINQIIYEHDQNPQLRVGQKKLAAAVVEAIHGKNELNKCIKISEALFSNNLPSLDVDELYEALKGVNQFDGELNEYLLPDLLVLAKVVNSKSQARNLISSGAISVNNQLVTTFDFKVTKADGINQKFSYIKKGKRDYFLIN